MKKKPLDSRATLHRLTYLADQGVLSREAWERACAIAGHTPTLYEWRVFINRALLVVGVIFIVAGILFLGAYNYSAPPRWTQFAGLQAGIIGMAALARFFGIDSLPGRLALLAALMLVGGLLAVIGQEYQTGADAYEVFLVWAGLGSGWVILSQWGPLWLVWWALVNLGLSAYGTQALGASIHTLIPLLILLNAWGIAAWEWGSKRGVHWLSARWIPRLAALVTVGMAVYFVLIFIFPDEAIEMRFAALPIYLILVAVMVETYTRYQRDLFMLAVCGLSGVVLSLALLFRFGEILDVDDLCLWGVFIFFAGLLVLAETTFMVSRLSQLQDEWEREP